MQNGLNTVSNMRMNAQGGCRMCCNRYRHAGSILIVGQHYRNPRKNIPPAAYLLNYMVDQRTQFAWRIRNAEIPNAYRYFRGKAPIPGHRIRAMCRIRIEIAIRKIRIGEFRQ